MLMLSSKAKLALVKGDIQFHGDRRVPVAVIKLSFEAVTAEEVAAAFVSQFALMFDNNGEPSMPELAAFKLGREVSNVLAKVDGVEIKGADVSGVTLKPIARNKCEMQLTLVGPSGKGVLDKLHQSLYETVKVVLEEREPEISKLEGGLAPSADRPGAALEQAGVPH